MSSETAVRARLAEWGQEHLVDALDKLSGPEKQKFLDQLSHIDYPNMIRAVENAGKSLEGSHATFEPPAAEDVMTLSSTKAGDRLRWWNMGLELIGSGKVAACILAGGQGTRMGLGIDESKGMLDIGLPSHKCIFQLFVERLRRIKTLSGNVNSCLPLLIMTSPLNDTKVRCFFKDHDHFGYSPQDVFFFPQGTLPALSYPEMKLILDSRSSLSESPDGNGGVYFSLSNSGVLDKLLNRGVEYVHIFAVDNALTRPADPVFIGFAAESNAEVANKVVWKSDWREKVGVVARRDGKNTVVEYSDLYNPGAGVDNPLIRASDPTTGKLLFGAGNICNHMLRLDFIKGIIPKLKTMYHVAHKSIPYFDKVIADVVTPVTNNGVKLEAFIFDAFELSSKSVILECKREEEFAPMKNKNGADSSETALAMVLSACSREGRVGEVSPLEFYFGEDIQRSKSEDH